MTSCLGAYVPLRPVALMLVLVVAGAACIAAALGSGRGSGAGGAGGGDAPELLLDLNGAVAGPDTRHVSAQAQLCCQHFVSAETTQRIRSKTLTLTWLSLKVE